VTVFFTSDTHFGHGGALGLYRRPFASVPAMNEAMIERWNETVGPQDEIWHLGDFAIRQPAAVAAELLGRLRTGLMPLPVPQLARHGQGLG